MRSTLRLIKLLTFVAGVMLPMFTRSDAALLNYIEYDTKLASSGQPTESQFAAVAEAGVERVFYLAFADDDGALLNEDRIVRDLGMQFIHIPVIWQQPEVRDFDVFAAALAQSEDQKILVHCQVNWRASSFVFLYRVLHQGIPIDEAYVDMRSAWSPNKTWQNFIFQVLAANNVSPECDLCEWNNT